MTMAMVAAPILLVTSYYLIARLGFGQERKRLAPAPSCQSE